MWDERPREEDHNEDEGVLAREREPAHCEAEAKAEPQEVRLKPDATGITVRLTADATRMGARLKADIVGALMRLMSGVRLQPDRDPRDQPQREADEEDVE